MFGKKKKMAKQNKNVETSMDMCSTKRTTSNTATKNCSGPSSRNK